ncbi:MAG TPA: restriction endonuclease subunit S [Paludibacter sp.]|nr:restriction endonuclease subunit S [Paludibacter sp.]
MSSVNNTPKGDALSLPKGWVETTLGNLSAPKGGKRLPLGESLVSSKTEHPYIRITDFNGNTINKQQLQFVPNEVFKSISKYIVNTNDVVISIVGTIGLIAKIDKELNNASLTENCVKLVDLKNIDASYLYYFLTSNLGQNEINKNTVGAVQKKLPIYGVQNLIIRHPLLPEQKSIAAILTAFDDKIELLQAQNNTLEETAQTIFKEWFGKYQIGDELPEGWGEGAIGDILEIKRGASPRPIQDYLSDSGYRWLKISDATATACPYIFNIKEHIKPEGLKNTVLKKVGDIVLSNSATPGMPKILAVDTCVHDGWMHFPSSKVSNEYLYLLFISIRPNLVQQGSGSVFTNLKTDILREYAIVIPPKNVFVDFDKLIKPVFNKILINASQIQSLTQTRDELLPKLMSGEIRVNEFDR